MRKIETERLILRNYETEDLKAVHEWFSSEEVARYEDFAPMTKEEVSEIIQQWKSMDNRLVVELKADGQVIGGIGYWVDEEGHHCMDYDFNPAYGHRGYATEAGKALLKYMFEHMKLDAVYADCDTQNISSWKLMERLGFQRMQKLDNQSYKNDEQGNPIIISTYLYEIERN